MEIKVADEAANQQQPLLEGEKKTPRKSAISQTFRSTADLSNLLPTGTFLAFQLLSPALTNKGKCSPSSLSLTEALIALCAVSCFALSFTDSFRGRDGKVRHGIATMKGLWVLDGTTDDAVLSPDEAARYKIRFIDFVHGFMGVLVFVAVVLIDQSVVTCLFPKPSEKMNLLLSVLPVGIGVVCSGLFVAFPTTRHGIGFPLSSD